MKIVIDLCAGLGGGSEAFMNNPDYRVIRIDNNPLLESVPNMHMMDLMKSGYVVPSEIRELVGDNEIFLILAGPTCTEFSEGFHAPIPTARREGRVHVPCTKLVERCMDLIVDLEPTHWIIENVRGSREWISPVIGHEPDQRVGPFYLWTSDGVPFLQAGGWLPPDFHHTKEVSAWSSDPLRANKRGKWPLELSEAIRMSLETPTLGRWT